MASSYLQFITKDWNPKIRTLLDDMKAKKDPDFFAPTGTQVYCGRQGSGKTVSAVKHVRDIKQTYPKSLLVSNLLLTELIPIAVESKPHLRYILRTIDPGTQYVYFQTMEELEIALTYVNNGTFGVMYLIDEIHTYFNALESKNIPMYVFTEISQQRKQRKLIIGTSQLFQRMAKPFREQCDNLIFCRTMMGCVTFQTAYDGMTLTQDYDGKLRGTRHKFGWFIHTPDLRQAYDTYQKVVSGAEQYENLQRMELSKNGKKIAVTG